MGRKRTIHSDLPKRLYLRHGAYYYVECDGRWNNLGRDRTVALKRVAAINKKLDVAAFRVRRTDRASLYVIGMLGRAEPVKIGVAVNVQNRLDALQTSQADRLEIKGSILVAPGEARRIERRAHAWLKEYRLIGEWFAVSFDDPTQWVELIQRVILDVPPTLLDRRQNEFA